MRFIFCGCTIFTVFAFLNLALLGTVVLKYSPLREEHSSIYLARCRAWVPSKDE